jgi:gluconate kinase
MIQFFEVEKEKCLYSRGWKDTIFAPKQQTKSIHLPIESILTLERLNPDEGNYMKIDASQEMYETIQATQMGVWINSR